ncbi:MAG: hypothetical protein AVDCRST_MAG33-3167 [uncultured Thermomicrobiales bacterium]|uniref:Winged helix DNA-binding domain-containing protein n=1 Tax=uncultured Thermomicrobiales bacterium TaxID=1645740 RepID=A0A6J4VFE0_9BACT|nr:MAG: hypothetical protein AVDCRST_MAG33-3167 [uncultured Thermomicrobiales bacterium]
MPTVIPDVSIDRLAQTRAERWCLTPDTRIAGPDEAPALIERAGIATLFPASPEVASLYAAFAGPDAPIEAGHSTPTGQVYGWRWVLGRREVAFYGAIVRGKPTWVAWPVLPALLHLRGDTRPVDEQVAAGLLSADAHRVAGALASNGGTLTTGELRRVAGFETGRERRAAYLRAIAELDRRLLLGRGFGPPDAPNDGDMRQTLVAVRYPEAVAAARAMAAATAMRHLLTAYLSGAVLIRPSLFARHLGLDRSAVEAALATMAREGIVERFRPEGEKQDVYAVTADSESTTPGGSL